MNYFKVLLEKQILKEELKNHFNTIINDFLEYSEYLHKYFKEKNIFNYIEYIDLIVEHILKFKMKEKVEDLLNDEKNSNISSLKFFEILNLRLINDDFYKKHIKFSNEMIKYKDYDLHTSELLKLYNRIAYKTNVAIPDYKKEKGLKNLNIFPKEYKAMKIIDMKTNKRF